MGPMPKPLSHSLSRTTLYVLQVVVVVGLGRRQEGEVVATVGDCGRKKRETEPERGRSDVRTHDQRTCSSGHHVRDDMLDGMCVDGANTNWCLPLVMDLVDMLVEERVVECPEVKKYKINFQNIIVLVFSKFS